MYTVKILSPENFDKLPFKRAHEALGAADKKTMTAYVRDTGYNDITKHTIEHELDELMQKTSPHEVDGIRYKIGGDLMKSVGGGIKNLFGGGASPLPSGVSPTPSYQSMIGSGAADAGLTQTVGSSLPGFGKTFSALPADVIPSSSKFSLGNAVNSVAPSVMDIFSNSRTGSQPMAAQNFPTSGASTSAPSSGGFGQAFSKNIFQPFKAGATDALSIPNATGQPSAGGGGDQNFMQSIFGKLGQKSPQIATDLIGKFLAPDPGNLDVSGVTDPLRARISGENPSDLFGLGSREAHRVLDAGLTEVPEEVFAQSERVIDEQLTRDLLSLKQAFKARNPNADVETNSAYLNKTEELKENARIQKQQNRQQVSYEHTQAELGRRLETMNTALNLDFNQSAQLIQLAQLDAEEIAINYQLSLDKADEFKRLFGEFGSLFDTQQQQSAAQQPATA